MNIEKEARKWIEDNYPLMNANNFNDCDELDVYDMISFAQHIKEKLEQRSNPISLKRFVMWRNADEEMPNIKQPVLMAVKCGSELKVEQGEYIGNNEWINCWFSKRCANTYPVEYWKPLEKPQAK